MFNKIWRIRSMAGAALFFLTVFVFGVIWAIAKLGGLADALVIKQTLP